MDLAPLIIICTPIFLPVAKAFGVDPVHFGVILILNGGIGLITPPVGSVLFVGAAIGKISVTRGAANDLAVLSRSADGVADGGRSCRSCRCGCRRCSSIDAGESLAERGGAIDLRQTRVS